MRDEDMLTYLSWLHTAAKDLVEHKRRVSADTYEVRVSDINAIVISLGMLRVVQAGLPTPLYGLTTPQAPYIAGPEADNPEDMNGDRQAAS